MILHCASSMHGFSGRKWSYDPSLLQLFYDFINFAMILLTGRIKINVRCGGIFLPQVEGAKSLSPRNESAASVCGLFLLLSIFCIFCNLRQLLCILQEKGPYYTLQCIQCALLYSVLRQQWRGQCICGLRRPSERSGGLDGYQETADGARNDCGDQDSFLRCCEMIQMRIVKHFILKESLHHPTQGEKEEHILR